MTDLAKSRKIFLNTLYGWYRKLIRNLQSRWLVVVATLAYLIVPTDLAPDFLPFVGQIDDAMIVSLLLPELSPLLIGKVKAFKSKAAERSQAKSNLAA